MSAVEARAGIRPHTLAHSAHSELTPGAIVLAAVFCLGISHFMLSAFFPSQVVTTAAFGLAWGVLFYVLCLRGDILGFAMILFICSHFSFEPNKGSIFSLLAAAVVPVYWLAFRRPGGLKARDRLVISAVSLFVALNALSWAMVNRMPTLPRFYGAAAFLGCVATFLLLLRLEMTPARVRTFLAVLGVGVSCNFLVSANQFLGIVDLKTPLLGVNPVSAVSAVARGYRIGSFQHSELAGEYSLFVALLVVPLLVSKLTRQRLGVKMASVIFLLLVALACVVMSAARSAVLLLGVGLLVYFLVFMLSRLKAVDSRVSFYSYGLVVMLFAGTVAAYLGLGEVVGKFQKMEGTEISVRGVLTGEAINRGITTKLGVQRIASGNWLLGYGAGIPESNQRAFFGTAGQSYDSKVKAYFADFHNMYLELPVLFGWAGGVLFLLLLLAAPWRSGRVLKEARRADHYLVVVVLGMLIAWLSFVIDQFKISIFRCPHVQMIFWTMLALTLASVATLKKDLREARKT